jgi:hypothetical protein
MTKRGEEDSFAILAGGMESSPTKTAWCSLILLFQYGKGEQLEV